MKWTQVPIEVVAVIGLVMSCSLLVAAEAPVAAKASKDVAAGRQEKTFRISVIGASISAGFGSGTRIAEVLDVAIDAPKTISDTSSMSFFMNPTGKAHKFMPAIYQSKPSLVLGIDFLFWFGYGPGSGESRVRRMQGALRLLDKLECPVIVGDLPQFPEGLMLSREMIPAKSDLEKINKLIHEWAKKKKNVLVYPLATLVKDIRAGNTIEVNGKKLKLEESKMFQFDGLHITRRGLVILVSKLLEKFPQVQFSDTGDPHKRGLEMDPGKIAKRLEAKRLEAKRQAEAKRQKKLDDKSKAVGGGQSKNSQDPAKGSRGGPVRSKPTP